MHDALARGQLCIRADLRKVGVKQNDINAVDPLPDGPDLLDLTFCRTFESPEDLMAEAAGLALGGIALASLVTTCVEFIEYFENGRHYVRDISLAVMKVKLMRCRLDQLGDIDSMSSMAASQGSLDIDRQAGREGSSHPCHALPGGLLGINEVLRRTGQLCRKYNRGRRRQVRTSGYDGSLRTLIGHRLAGSRCQLAPGDRKDPCASSSSPWVLTVAKSISWAFLDKKRFNDLISDFDFILSNLEKIVEGLNAKHVYHLGDAPGVPEMSNQGKKMDRHGGQASLGAAARGVEFVPAPSTGTLDGTVYRGNHTKNQAIQILGSQAQEKDARDKLGPENRAVYETNLADHQSFACYGSANADLVGKLAEEWGKVAIAAITQKNKDQASVSHKLSRISGLYCLSDANKSRQRKWSPKLDPGEPARQLALISGYRQRIACFHVATAERVKVIGRLPSCFGSEPAWLRRKKKAKRQPSGRQRKRQGRPLILRGRGHLTLARHNYA